MYARFSSLLFVVFFLLAIISFKINNLPLLIFFLMVFYIFFLKSFYNHGKVFYSMILIVAIHQLATIYNVFIDTLPGASGDALAFSEHALLVIENNDFSFVTGSALFEKIIAIIYIFFGVDYFMLSELFLIFYSYTCVKFIKILDQLGLKDNKHIPLLFYGLLPSGVIHLSIPLREVFELGLILIMFSYLYDYINHGRYKSLVKLIVPFVLLSLLHRATIIYPWVCYYFHFFTIKRKGYVKKGE